MNEIEIKLQLDNKEAVIEKLKTLGCKFTEPKKQIDTIFLDNKMTNFDIKIGMIVLRIRETNNNIILTLKQRKENIMESKEIEFKVEDYKKCKELLETLGYKEMVTIKKERITTKYKDYNICIDEVEELGSFIELEVITDENNKSEYYEKEMYKICKDLELNTNSRVYSHYDTMLYEKNNKKDN